MDLGLMLLRIFRGFSEQKSGRGKSDYQRDLFSDSRRYCLHEWRVLYCLKHDAECRPGWSLLHKHYPNLLVRDVLMVLPKETVRHFLAALSGFTDVAHNDEARVLVQPFSLFIKRGESAHVYDIDPLTDWLTLSMYHALAQAVNGGVIAPRSGMVSFDDTVSWGWPQLMVLHFCGFYRHLSDACMCHLLKVFLC